METNQSTTNQDSIGVGTQPQQASSNNKLFAAVTISVLLTGVIAGSTVYFWQKSANERMVSNLEQKISSLEEQISTMKKARTTPLPTSLPELSPTSIQLPAVKGTKTYTDPDGRYRFNYLSDWEVLDKVPEKFRAKQSYVEGGDLEEWLRSKMIAGPCRGPTLQNIADNNQLIVFEVIDAKSTEGFYCWSSGYFMENDKWKRSGKYAYPLGTTNLREPEWRGDYLKMVGVAENDKFVVIAALINYETFQLKGETALQTIISSFQFQE